MEKEKFNFRKEFYALPNCNQKTAKQEIMKILNIKTSMGFNYRLNGINDSSLAEQEAIKAIIINNREVQVTLQF